MASCPCGQRNSPEAGLKEVFAVPDSDFEENSSEEEIEKENSPEGHTSSEEDIEEGIESDASDTSIDNNQQQQPHGVDRGHE